MNVIIDYFEYSKTFELWNVEEDCRHYTRDFKSLKAAINFCNKNKLTHKIGLSCDG